MTSNISRRRPIKSSGFLEGYNSIRALALEWSDTYVKILCPLCRSSHKHAAGKALTLFASPPCDEAKRYRICYPVRTPHTELYSKLYSYQLDTKGNEGKGCFVTVGVDESYKEEQDGGRLEHETPDSDGHESADSNFHHVSQDDLSQTMGSLALDDSRRDSSSQSRQYDTTPENQEQLFLEYCRKNDTEQITKLASANPDHLINAEDGDGNTCISHAARWGNIKLLCLLHSLGGNIEHCNKAGSTPLMQAASVGHVGIVQYLLSEKVETDVCDKHGHTALHYALPIEASRESADVGIPQGKTLDIGRQMIAMLLDPKTGIPSSSQPSKANTTTNSFRKGCVFRKEAANNTFHEILEVQTTTKTTTEISTSKEVFSSYDDFDRRTAGVLDRGPMFGLILARSGRFWDPDTPENMLVCGDWANIAKSLCEEMSYDISSFWGADVYVEKQLTAWYLQEHYVFPPSVDTAKIYGTFKSLEAREGLYKVQESLEKKVPIRLIINKEKWVGTYWERDRYIEHFEDKYPVKVEVITAGQEKIHYYES